MLIKIILFSREKQGNKASHAEKKSASSKSLQDKDGVISKLRDELSEIRKWKTKFLKKERERLKKTRRIIEKRKVRRDYIMKEIEAGRMTQKDLYLIYSKNRLPIDTLPKMDDDVDQQPQQMEEVDEAADMEGLDISNMNETEAAVAGIVTPNAKPQINKRFVPKKPTLVKEKYPAIPHNPTTVFTYKLKPAQKVHLPYDHPQINNIRNRDRVEVVYNEAQNQATIHQPPAGAEPPKRAPKRKAKRLPVKIKPKAARGGKRRPPPESEEDTTEEESDYEQVQQEMQVPTEHGTVTLKYEAAYSNPEFIHMPVTTTTPVTLSAGVVQGTSAGYGQDQMDFIVKTVDDLEQLKYGGGTSAPTYYIQPAPNAANVNQLGQQLHPQQVQFQPQQQQQQQPRTSPRKHHKYSKYGNYL